MRRPLSFLCLALMLAATGCGGWYLRGTGPEAGKIRDLMLIKNNAMQIGNAFQVELYYNKVTYATTREKARIIVELTGESFERRVLSVDPATGKVREIELTLEVGVTVRGRGGRLLVNNQRMSWVEDFVFDEISALGTEAQEVTTKQELAKTAARALMLRLETLDFDQAEPVPAAPARAKTTR